MTTAEYPTICTITAEELDELRDAYLHNEDFELQLDNWPPRDDLGNPYPIWFTLDEVDENGWLKDRNGSSYSPFAGNLEPRWDPNGEYCNAVLRKWTFRFPDTRYCSRRIHKDAEHHCSSHVFHETMKSAEEYVQTGAFTLTVDHLYEDLSPWKKLMAWGTFESLMGESVHEFAPEQDAEVLDFSDEPVVPDDVDEEDRLEVGFSYPTDHVRPAQALYVAAMQQVTMMQVQARVLWEGQRQDGTEEGVMESRSVEKAQLTAPPSEHDPSAQEFKTIETWSEHHLNLPLSRLITDQPKLLEMGGVSTDPADEVDDIGAEEIVLELDAADAEADTGTDATAVGDDFTSQSDKIAQKATTEEAAVIDVADADDPDATSASADDSASNADDEPSDT